MLRYIVRFSQQTAITALNSTKRLVFVIEMEYVGCEVENESLYILSAEFHDSQTDRQLSLPSDACCYCLQFFTALPIKI